MNFAEKLRALRKQFKFSQEQLAEKLNVSRQAITKWETEGGLPDIENLMAIAALFSVSMDELLSAEKLTRAEQGFAYTSVTEYDVSRVMHFDIHAPGALEVRVTTSPNEKLRVQLASQVLQTIDKDYKVQIDEHRSRMDVDIRRSGEKTTRTGKRRCTLKSRCRLLSAAKPSCQPRRKPCVLQTWVSPLSLTARPPRFLSRGKTAASH